MLRNVSNVNMKTTIMGNEIDFPIGIAPSGLHKLAHPEGEIATARGNMLTYFVDKCITSSTISYHYTIAALSTKTCMVLSTWASTSIEEVAQANGSGLRWFQLYVFKDKSMTMDLIERAERAGYKAIVITVDRPYGGKRMASYRNKFILPSHLKFANPNITAAQTTTESQQQPGTGLYSYLQTQVENKLTWDTITWVKSFTKLPVIVKGILTGEDAKLAVQHGVDGIIVSNHGGRQLDGVLATVRSVLISSTFTIVWFTYRLMHWEK